MAAGVVVDMEEVMVVEEEEGEVAMVVEEEEDTRAVVMEEATSRTHRGSLLHLACLQVLEKEE